MRPTVLGINNYHWPRGGSERYFLELGRLLVERGHRVVHLSTRDQRNHAHPGAALFLEPNELERPGIGAVLRFHHSRSAARAVRDLLREERPDLAHLHIYYGQLTASILAPLRRAGLPIVQTLHEYRLLCPVSTLVSGAALCEACGGRSFHRALPRRCNRGSLARTLVSVSESYLSRWLGAASSVDHFIASSEFARAKLIAHGFSPGRITTVPNFVDGARLRPAHGPGQHFLFCGRIERLKGVLTLLEASALVPEVPLVFAGEGEARPALETRIRELGLEHVRVLGYRGGEELFDLVRGSLCVVLPSQWYENCPLALLEAMALGRAVVASRIGGIPELLEDGVTGRLFEPGNAQELASLLRWMAQHRREAEQMGVRGRERALEHFGPSQHYERLMQVYRRVGVG